METLRLYLYALPVFLGLIALEALYYRVALHRPYGWKVTLSSLGVSLGQYVAESAGMAVKVAVYVAAYQARLFDIAMDRWESWLLLFIALEFAYYWQHRCSHRIRWMWAQHSVHHSARQLTLSVAYRLGWTNLLGGQWLFLMPLCLVGFDPRAVGLMFAINLAYQFWLHTETVPKLGWYERIFNTPSHHRVHHAVEPDYLDHNYGGVLIVFDRLFGTFTEERTGAPITYGLVRQIETLNPVRIAVNEWLGLIADLRRSRSMRDALGYCFLPPGWRPGRVPGAPQVAPAPK